MIRRGWLVVLGVAIGAVPLHAQGRIGADTTVATAYRPPTGMCRVWLDGVPAVQQPASTDCATAMRTRPPRSRVIFGDPVRENPTAGASAFRAGSAAYGPPVLPPVRRRRDEPANETPKRPLHGDLCLDADHDGLCDDTAAAADACLDANRDGKCDEPLPAIRTEPAERSAQPTAKQARKKP